MAVFSSCLLCVSLPDAARCGDGLRRIHRSKTVRASVPHLLATVISPWACSLGSPLKSEETRSHSAVYVYNRTRNYTCALARTRTHAHGRERMRTDADEDARMQTQMHGRRRRRMDADSDARTCTQTQTNANLRACRAWVGESSRRVLPLNGRSRTFEMYYTMYVPSLLELPLWLRSTTLMLCKSESKLVPGLSHLVHTANF